MPIPDTLARKITADFRAEKKYGGRKKFCDALKGTLAGRGQRTCQLNRLASIGTPSLVTRCVVQTI